MQYISPVHLRAIEKEYEIVLIATEDENEVTDFECFRSQILKPEPKNFKSYSYL